MIIISKDVRIGLSRRKIPPNTIVLKTSHLLFGAPRFKFNTLRDSLLKSWKELRDNSK